MFVPPNIVLIKNFDFERPGSTPKDKFIIILFQTDDEAIIAPLTTSKDRVPDEHKTKRCIHVHGGADIHCYYIPKKLTIGRSGFQFVKDTYIHINPSNLKRRSLTALKTKYEITGAAELKDALIDGEYSDFLYCMYKSRHVPRGVKRAMEPVIERLEQGRNPF